MASNDQIILNQVLEQQRQTIAPSFDPAMYFEIFTASQLLRIMIYLTTRLNPASLQVEAMADSMAFTHL